MVCRPEASPYFWRPALSNNANSKKPKVLFVGPYPPPYAGPEMAMKTLLGSPLTREFEVSFLRTNVRDRNADKGKIDFSLVKAFFRFIILLSWLLTTKRPELVYHFVTANRVGWFGRDIWCIAISRLFGAKVVIHMRAGHFKYIFQNFHFLEKVLIKYVCKWVNRALVQANVLKDQFEGIMPLERVRAVYNAVDSKKFENSDLTDYDRNMVLFLGHLSFGKGYCDVLRIIPKVANAFPEVRFCFAGEKIRSSRNILFNQVTGTRLVYEDPDQCYHEYVEGCYEPNYEYFGVADENRKITLLKRCNFLLLPSYSEGFSMAVLEAITAGKPVVCTGVGALKEVVVDGVNGLVVEPGNVSALSDAILTLLVDEEGRNRIAQTNYAYARQVFAQRVISKQIAECFHEALHSNSIEQVSFGTQQNG